MKIALWIVQVLLAFAFAASGLMKTFVPIEELAANMTFIEHTPHILVRIAGVSEVLGAIGLILPAATRIKPVLTPIAASGLVLVMVLAAGLHVMLGELAALPPNFVLGGLAAFVAWGRFVKAPIEPRGASSAASATA